MEIRNNPPVGPPIKFNVDYILKEGWIHAKGQIIKGSTKYEISLDIHDLEVDPQSVKEIYNEKILHLIEGFQIGERISELYLENDKISQKEIGASKSPELIPWTDYKEEIKNREKVLKQQLVKYSETIETKSSLGEVLKKVNELSDIQAKDIRYINESFHKEIKNHEQLKTILSHLLNLLVEKEVHQLVEPILLKTSVETVVPLRDRQVVPHNSNENVQEKEISAIATKSIDQTKRASKIAAKRSFLGRIYHKFFFDGNAAWKQQKYQVALSQTIDAFEKGPKELKNLKFNRLMEPRPISDIIRDFKQISKPTSLEKLTRKTLEALLATKTSKDQRKTYRKFVEALRKALESPEYAEAAKLFLENQNQLEKNLLPVKILMDLCLIRFTENKMYSFNDTLVHSMVGIGKEVMKDQKGMQLPKSNASAKTDVIVKAEVEAEMAEEWEAEPHEKPLANEDFKAIDNMPQELKAPGIITGFEKLLGHMNFSFDPHYKSNIPYVNYDFDINGKSMSCLRIGTPTIQSHPWSTRINPEFKAFLQAYQALGKKHVYFNLQKGKSSGFLNSFGNERTRTEALKKLGTEEFSKTFTVFVLDQDSKFYQQVDEYGTPTILTNTFIESFHKKMTDPQNSAFYIPQAIYEKDREFNKHMKDLMGQLQRTMYPGRTSLTVEERKDFIELYYAAFELLVLKTLDPDSFNASCKDAIDRGGKNNAILLKIVQILTHQDQNPQQVQALETIGLAPSLIVKQRTVLEKHERRKRLVDPMDALNRPRIAEQFREGFGNAKELFGIDPNGQINFYEKSEIEYQDPSKEAA